jgi:cation transport ATPase
MHGDHEDYLAIASDGSLLLAHDSDQCCDGTDFHGALSLVSRRQLSNTISMTFFKLDEKEFNILDYVDKIVPSLSKPVVDPRVDAAIGLDKVFSPKNSPNRTNGKSTIHVSNICCASEVPPITETCESLIGVTKVTVNVTNKLVYVYHDYKSLPAISIVDALNYAGFGATLKKDARPKILPPPSDNKTIGKSSFAIANMCCASEVPPIMQILEPLPGVSSVKCNVTAKLVYVEHDFFVITAEKMMDELNKDGFGATIKKNAGKTVTFIASVDSPAVEEPVGVLESFGLPNANVIVCGFLWILSMFAPAFPPPYNQLEDLALLAFAVGIYPIALKTLDSVRRLSMDANLLMFIAAVGAVGLQQFSEAAGLTFLFSLGEWLESRATGKAKRALESIVSLRPDTANRQVVGDGGSTEFVEVRRSDGWSEATA